MKGKYSLSHALGTKSPTLLSINSEQQIMNRMWLSEMGIRGSCQCKHILFQKNTPDFNEWAFYIEQQKLFCGLHFAITAVIFFFLKSFRKLIIRRQNCAVKRSRILIMCSGVMMEILGSYQKIHQYKGGLYGPWPMTFFGT
jgi:Protein of unknown function (DUF2919).